MTMTYEEVKMPPDEVQRHFCGASGELLLAQSAAFVEAMMAAFRRYSGELRGPVLDYGCGWGRLLRMMLKHRQPEQLLYGCDPWEPSIKLCEEYNVPAHLSLCDYLPEGPPFAGTRFALIYAFSVFTHLSERTGKAVARVLRSAIEPDGLFVITIRDEVYWRRHDQKKTPADVESMEANHRARGFAFTPHEGPLVDGDVTYGDTSMSLDYIASAWPHWRLLGHEVLPNDPLQRIVYLRPN